MVDLGEARAGVDLLGPVAECSDVVGEPAADGGAELVSAIAAAAASPSGSVGE